METKQDPGTELIEKASKLQPIILGVVLLAYVGKVQHWPFSGIALIISTGILMFFYFLKGNRYIDITWSSADRLIHRFSFYALAIGIAAFLFHLQRWAGWELLSLLSIMGFTVIFMILVRKKVAITKYLSMIELSSMVLVFIHFMRVYMAQVQF